MKMNEAAKDIECRVCGRITFEWEHNKLCPQCHWPVRPVELEEPVFGWDVAIRVADGGMKSKIVEKHFVTPSEKTARRRAKLTPGFQSVAAVNPLSERQWISGYGDPRNKLKFS